MAQAAEQTGHPAMYLWGTCLTFNVLIGLMDNASTT